jgi:hypothetical protein
MSDTFPDQRDDDEPLKLPSEKSFAVTIAVVFTVIGLLPLLHGGSARLWALAVAAAFLAAGFLTPALLRPLNRVWMRFGALLHRIVNPLILGLMFALIVTPVGLFLRLTGSKLLSPRPDPAATSYWIAREPPGPDADSVRNQF